MSIYSECKINKLFFMRQITYATTSSIDCP